MSTWLASPEKSASTTFSAGGLSLALFGGEIGLQANEPTMGRFLFRFLSMLSSFDTCLELHPLGVVLEVETSSLLCRMIFPMTLDSHFSHLVGIPHSAPPQPHLCVFPAFHIPEFCTGSL